MFTSRRRKELAVAEKEGRMLFLFALPLIALILVFSYAPLLGWIYAFFDYTPGLKLSQCEFKGLFFFKMLISDPISRDDLVRVLKNTFGISFLTLLCQVLPLVFAIFINEMRAKRFRSIIQTATSFPNFLSWPLVYIFAFTMFSTQTGFVNVVLMNLHIIKEPITFLASPNHVWLTQTGYFLWKSLGWSAIIYIASIASIDGELYEAAKIDGAGRFRIMWNITVPHILPTFFVILLLCIANLLNNGIDQYLVFENAMNKDHIEVLDLFVYNTGIKNGMFGYNYSFATAVGVLKSLVSIGLLFSVNFISKRIRGESIV